MARCCPGTTTPYDTGSAHMPPTTQVLIALLPPPPPPPSLQPQEPRAGHQGRGLLVRRGIEGGCRACRARSGGVLHACSGQLAVIWHIIHDIQHATISAPAGACDGLRFRLIQQLGRLPAVSTHILCAVCMHACSSQQSGFCIHAAAGCIPASMSSIIQRVLCIPRSSDIHMPKTDNRAQPKQACMPLPPDQARHPGRVADPAGLRGRGRGRLLPAPASRASRPSPGTGTCSCCPRTTSASSSATASCSPCGEPLPQPLVHMQSCSWL